MTIETFLERNNPQIGERLKIIRKKFGLNQDQIAIEFGITRQTYLRYENWERVPDAVFLTKFIARFNINANWLLFGISNVEMFSGSEIKPGSLEDYVLVPEISPASCGSSGRIAETDILGHKAFDAKFLKKFKNPVLTKAIGDSMLPLIKPGDLLLCDRDPEKRLHPDRRHIYMVNDSEDPGEVTLKIKRMGLSGRELYLIPLNLDEEITTIYIKDKNMLDIVLGVIVWMSRDLVK